MPPPHRAAAAVSTLTDLQTGNVEPGKAIFQRRGRLREVPLRHRRSGAASPSATKGCRLEERMLYPATQRAQVTVTLPSGENVSWHTGLSR